MIALGLDTSCYTTSVAVAGQDGQWAGARQLLPVSLGQRGLRQSEAVFAHVKQIPGLIEPLLRDREPIGLVCASVSPRDGDMSYMPVFSVGETVGRSIAAALHVPFAATTHQRGHLRAALVDSGLCADHYLALHLSGGTTDVMRVAGDAIELIGCSLDLHAGQLVDRIGVRMGLPFPAGPEMEKLAAGTSAQSVVPVSFDKAQLSVHLSGAEAQLLRLIDAGTPHEQVAAETYDIIARSVLRLLCAAAEKTGEREILLAGGVMASARLRGEMIRRNEKRRLGLALHFGKPELSGDNAVGVALLGAERLG